MDFRCVLEREARGGERDVWAVKNMANFNRSFLGTQMSEGSQILFGNRYLSEDIV